MKQPCVYIMASKINGTLYVGVTADLLRRVWQHREGVCDGFTKRYNIKMLVWYELYATMPEAIKRETDIKAWKRAWKIDLINAMNPDWIDLYAQLRG